MGVITVDGSILEGGGQILRTTIALAALLARDVRITNVRAKRSPPGLRPQHLTGVKAVGAIVDAEIEGLSVGSMNITFRPRRRLRGLFSFDIGTAGSIPLVLQALMPAAAFAPSSLLFRIAGGTNCKWSPPIDCIRLVLLPTLARMGYRGEVNVERRGHYPRGGGIVRARFEPVPKLKPFSLLQLGDVTKVNGISYCVKLPRHVAERQARSAESVLRHFGYDVDMSVEWYPPARDPHLDPGSGVILRARGSTGAIVGADAMGERGKPAEVVGKEAAEKLLREIRSGASADRHLGDMLVPYAAVADGHSAYRVSEITLHTLTNIAVTERITGVRFKVEGELGKPGLIEVEGLGLKNEALG